MTDKPSPPAAAPEPPKPGRSARLTRVLLVLSLGLNLAIIGLVLGVMVFHGDRHEERTGKHDRREGARIERDLGFGPYGRALHRDDWEELRSLLGPRRDALQGKREELRGTFEKTLVVLRAEPFDRAEMQAQMARQSVLIRETAQIGQEVLLNHIEEMSPEERAAFADRLERGLGREPRRFKDR